MIPNPPHAIMRLQKRCGITRLPVMVSITDAAIHAERENVRKMATPITKAITIVVKIFRRNISDRTSSTLNGISNHNPNWFGPLIVLCTLRSHESEICWNAATGPSAK